MSKIWFSVFVVLHLTMFCLLFWIRKDLVTLVYKCVKAYNQSALKKKKNRNKKHYRLSSLKKLEKSPHVFVRLEVRFLQSIQLNYTNFDQINHIPRIT